MSILGSQGLRKSYGDRDILLAASVTVDATDRIGLVGRNGSGKSTLVRILAGIEEPDGGQVTRARGLRLAYLPQEPVLPPEQSALDVVLGGLAAWSAAIARHEAASARISAGEDPAGHLAEQAAAAAEVERLGGWDLRHRAEAVLEHLGISDHARRIGTMSGGERRRVAMARLLVSAPDVAILDEPTNHLDIDTIEWLERYLLERFAGALLLVTHDRYLLDRVVTRTLELDQGAVHAYDGGWEEYLAARAERAAHAERAESNRRNFLRRELEWLRRQPKARTGKQKARISRAQSAIAEEGPQQDGSARIAMGEVRSGKTVLDLAELCVDIAGKRVVDGLTLSLGKGERIGIIGPNGAGKTTLVRTLLGEHEPTSGTLTVGKNTRIAYLDQGRGGLDDEATVFDNVAEGRATVTLGENTMEVRAYLERFLFDGHAQKQKVGTLSGGERARVALARILREDANVVILDEPTNDLDVTTLSALEEALMSFGGTVLLVTHDRWVLDRVATSILAFEGEGRVVHVHGGYGDYLRYRAHTRREQEREQAEREQAAKPARPTATAPASGAAEPDRKKLTYGEEIELAGMMDEIDAAETRVAELETELAAASTAGADYTRQAALAEELASARARAEALVERWADLESRK